MGDVGDLEDAKSGRLSLGQDVHFQGHRSPGRSQAAESESLSGVAQGGHFVAPNKDGFPAVCRNDPHL